MFFAVLGCSSMSAFITFMILTGKELGTSPVFYLVGAYAIIMTCALFILCLWIATEPLFDSS
jgi:hypothetical protein